MLWQAVRRCSWELLTPTLSLSGVEADGTDVVSEAVPTQHQASGLQAALMSSPEWLAGWWRWSILSPPPHSVCPTLIGGRRKRDFRVTEDNTLVKEGGVGWGATFTSFECKLLHPDYNFQNRLEDYLSQYVLSLRTRTCVKWGPSGGLFGRC